MNPIENLESRTLLSATPASIRPAIASGQTHAIRKLLADVRSIRVHSSVTQSMISQFLSDAAGAVSQATRPSAASISRLKADVKSAFSDHKLTTAEKDELTADAQAVLASAKIPDAAVQAVGTDLNAIITASGVTNANVKTLIGDLQSLAAAFHV